MNSEVLLVHCYELERHRYGRVGLGDLAEAICQKVGRIHHKYRFLLILGGYDLINGKPHPIPQITLATEMTPRLKELGVPDGKIFNHLSTPATTEFILPRDTTEEVNLAGILFYDLHIPNDVFDVICIGYFVPRVWYLYWRRGLRPRKVIPTWGWKTLKPARIVMAGIVAFVVYGLNPFGEYQSFFGKMIHLYRTRRTPQECADKKPIPLYVHAR